MSSPDPQPRPPPPTTSPYQQPSLPSIRQLHPYLPPSGMPQPHLPAQATSTYTYPLHAPYAGPSSTDPHISPPASSHTAMYPRSELLESEAEGEAEPQGPAKKKRRRQALSCNGMLVPHDFGCTPDENVLSFYLPRLFTTNVCRQWHI